MTEIARKELELPLHVRSLMGLQQTYHVANIFFEYNYDPRYYAMRQMTYFIPNVDDNGRVKFSVEKNQIGLLDQKEVDEMVSNIDFLNLGKNTFEVIKYVQDKLATVNTLPASMKDVIELIKLRLNSIQRLSQSILNLPEESTDSTDKDKLVVAALWQLNGLFKDDKEDSMRNAGMFLHFIQM